MGPFKLLYLILLALGLIGTVSTLPADPATPDPDATQTWNLEPLYVVKTGAESVSGCDAHLDNLKLSYAEAMKMAVKAKAAFVTVQQSRPPKGAPGYDGWNKISTLLLKLFRVSVDLFGHTSTPDPNVLQNDDDQAVIFNALNKPFQNMLSVGGDPEPALDIITYVACTDAGVTLYKPTDKDPRDNSKLLNAEGEYPNGAYYLPGDGKEFPSFIIKAVIDRTTGEVQTVHSKFCDEDNETEGATIYGKHELVVFCTPGLTLPAEAQPGSVVAGQRLSTYSSLSEVWVHELMHVWTGLRDEIRCDPKDTTGDTTGPQRDDNGNWILKRLDPERKAAYGASTCMQLAMYYPKTAIINADNFASFALGIWLDEWYWFTGYAIAG